MITWSLLFIWHYESMKLETKILIIMLFVSSWSIDWSLERVSFVSIVEIRCQVTCEKRWNQTFVNKFVKVRLFEFLLHNKFNISGSLSENYFLCWVPSSQRQGGVVPEKMVPLCKDDVGWGREGKNNAYKLESKPSH